MFLVTDTPSIPKLSWHKKMTLILKKVKKIELVCVGRKTQHLCKIRRKNFYEVCNSIFGPHICCM